MVNANIVAWRSADFTAVQLHENNNALVVQLHRKRQCDRWHDGIADVEQQILRVA